MHQQSGNDGLNAGDDVITGPTWSVGKAGDSYVFEYESFELGGLHRQEVTQEDFESLRAGVITELDLMLKYSLG